MKRLSNLLKGVNYMIIPIFIYLLSSLFDMGLTLHLIQSPWQEANPWIRFLMIYFGKWSLVPATIIEIVIVIALANYFAKQGSRVLTFCSLAVPMMIHILAGLMWLQWTGLAEKVTIMQLQLLGVIIVTVALITDLIMMKRKKIS